MQKALLLTLPLLFLSCGLGLFNGEGFIAGITVTDENGNVLEVDSDDWKPLNNALSVKPAYPNPTTNEIYIELIAERSFGEVKVYLNGKQVAQSIRLSAGSKGFTLSIPTGINRIKIEVKEDSRTHTTHGDVLRS